MANEWLKFILDILKGSDYLTKILQAWFPNPTTGRLDLNIQMNDYTVTHIIKHQGPEPEARGGEASVQSDQLPPTAAAAGKFPSHPLSFIVVPLSVQVPLFPAALGGFVAALVVSEVYRFLNRPRVAPLPPPPTQDDSTVAIAIGGPILFSFILVAAARAGRAAHQRFQFDPLGDAARADGGSSSDDEEE